MAPGIAWAKLTSLFMIRANSREQSEASYLYSCQFGVRHTRVLMF